MFMMRNLVSREISDTRNENRLYYLMNRQLSKQTYKCLSPTNATLQAFCYSVVISMEMIQTSTLVFFHPFIYFLLEHVLVFPRSQFGFISLLIDIWDGNTIHRVFLITAALWTNLPRGGIFKHQHLYELSGNFYPSSLSSNYKLPTTFFSIHFKHVITH